MVKKIKISNEELVKLAQSGDEEARELLFIKNQAGIVKVAKARYTQGNLVFDYDDIYQEAMIAFNNAINRFDISKGFKFITYAMQAMNNQISRYKTNTNSASMYVPVRKREILVEYGKISMDYPEKTRKEILNEIGISEKDFNDIEISFNVASLDLAVGSRKCDIEDLHPVLCLASMYNNSTWDFDKIEVKEYIDKVMNNLSDKERFVISKRIDGYTQKEIADIYNQTDGAIYSVERKAKIKLKSYFKKEGIEKVEDLIKC